VQRSTHDREKRKDADGSSGHLRDFRPQVANPGEHAEEVCHADLIHVALGVVATGVLMLLDGRWQTQPVSTAPRSVRG